MKQYEFLSKSIFNINDIKKEIKNEVNLFQTIKRLQDNRIIKKLKSGLYATIDPLTGDVFANKYEIATACYDGNYIAYHSAIEYYGLANQVYFEVHAATTKHYSPIEIEGQKYCFFYSKYEEGIVETMNNSIIRITELERTIVDCVNRLQLAGGLEEVYYALSTVHYLDEVKLLRHLQNYDMKFLYKKIGFIFSLIKPDYLSNNFYVCCKNNMLNRYEDLRTNKSLPYEYNSEWKLIVPKYITNTEN